jgi:hypothetical protein
MILIMLETRESRRMKRFDEECSETSVEEYLKTTTISGLVSQSFF